MAADDAMTLIEQVVPDLQVSSFFVPAERRPAVLAIFGFEAELTHIALQVAEPMVAQIRYAWWRDQIDAVFAGRDVHAPAVKAIVPVVAAHGLPRSLFDALVDGHAHDCEEAPYPDLAFLEEYAMSTSGSVMKLVARVLGAGAAADAAAEHAGIAYELARQMHGFAHWASHRRLRLPLDALQGTGLTIQEVFSGSADADVLMPAFAVVKHRMIDRLRLLGDCRFPRPALAALAPAAMARIPAARGYSPLTSPPVAAWQRVLRMSWVHLTGRI
jgi:phytoene synthase